MKRFLSPKQVAHALGVSESSLKRWCDSGTLPMQRTAGGHRKIPVTAVVEFVRDSRREIIRPDLLGLPAKRKTELHDLSDSVSSLASSLATGEIESSRQLVFGHYVKGQSIAKICDELLTPALAVIGNRWRGGDRTTKNAVERSVELIVIRMVDTRAELNALQHLLVKALGPELNSDGLNLDQQTTKFLQSVTPAKETK